MTKKSILIFAASMAMLVTGTAMMLAKKHQQAASDLLPVDVQAIKMVDGWGYEVLVDKKVFIHQDCIPAIASFKKFSTASEALLIGNSVVAKIKQGHKPFISLQEINEAHITY